MVRLKFKVKPCTFITWYKLFIIFVITKPSIFANFGKTRWGSNLMSLCMLGMPVLRHSKDTTTCLVQDGCRRYATKNVSDDIYPCLLYTSRCV